MGSEKEKISQNLLTDEEIAKIQLPVTYYNGKKIMGIEFTNHQTRGCPRTKKQRIDQNQFTDLISQRFARYAY